jgi:hypothetical protein
MKKPYTLYGLIYKKLYTKEKFTNNYRRDKCDLVLEVLGSTDSKGASLG